MLVVKGRDETSTRVRRRGVYQIIMKWEWNDSAKSRRDERNKSARLFYKGYHQVRVVLESKELKKETDLKITEIRLEIPTYVERGGPSTRLFESDRKPPEVKRGRS